jgi:hypothetical protein
MSPRAYITKRATGAGEMRYVVRYRWGGRGFKLVHLASKRSLREARELRDWAAGELAAARDPRAGLAAAAQANDAPARITLERWWDRFVAARLDTAKGTQRNYRKARDRFSPLLGSRDPSSLGVADIQEAVARLAVEIEPTTLHKYVSTLRLVLDFAGVDPNVARDRRVRLPRIVREEPEPPDAGHVLAIVNALTPRWILAFVTAEQTGM